MFNVDTHAGQSDAKQRHGSFRIAAAVFAGIDERADELSIPRNQLIERYLAEGLRRDRHPLIAFREGEAGRRPAIVGTRLDVAQVITTLRAEDGDVAATAEYFQCATATVIRRARADATTRPLDRLPSCLQSCRFPNPSPR